MRHPYFEECTPTCGEINTCIQSWQPCDL